MLDSLRVLRGAAEAYRTAATAAGLAWPDHAAAERPDLGGEPAPDLVHRLFAVDQVAEQLSWLQAQGWDSQRLFPNGGWLLPWPTDVGETLDKLSFTIGTPFPWRQQIPLFQFDLIVYTFVLAGEHEGEIWRYEASPDAWDSVRASTSLAALFTQWADGIAGGVVSYRELDQWLIVGAHVQDPFQELLERAVDLDPFAFPVSVPYPWWSRLRERQRECGVDLECIERGDECQLELLDAIAAARASLRG
ncbi:hypothetical protein GCM10023322_08970 [Rugosimonospora acidiphila]|uniref:Uncharacterized protein n=1 Tax=Rugosimonospora acidiphila TaxID=556531 RepID=A0ABP9RLN2_9ACTN